MYFLWEEIGDATKGCFNALTVVSFEKSHIRLVFSFAVAFTTNAHFHLLTRCQQVLYFIAGVGGIGVELNALGQIYRHGLESRNVDKGTGMDIKLHRQGLGCGDHLLKP